MNKNFEKIQSLVAEDIPVLLWGEPGTGKTSAIQAFAEKQGYHCETLIGSILDPTDFGRPVLDSSGDVFLAPPSWARRLRESLDQNRKCLLQLDELTCCPPSIQAALLRVVQERQVADLSLQGVRIIGAANDIEDAADGQFLAPSLANRWCHLEWNMDPDYWISRELGGWGNPNPELAESRSDVCGFIRTRPDLLLSKTVEGERTNPSPRAWSAVARLGKNRDLELVQGLVGKSAGTEFYTHLAQRDLPDPREVLCGNAKMPTRGDQVYAVGLSCVAVCAAGITPWKSLWRLLDQVRLDTAVAIARAAKAACPELPYDEKLSRVLDAIREA